MNRPELNEKARAAGVENPEQYKTKAQVTQAIQAAEAEGDDLIGSIVVVYRQGGFGFQTEGLRPTELPTLLRLAANEAEKTLGV